MGLSQAQILTAIADFAQVFRTPDGETAYATLEINGHRETWPIRSKGFRRWLVGRFYTLEQKPPGAQALQDALGAIEARAQFGNRTHPVYVRVGGSDKTAVYLDLANEPWEAVEITAAGWQVVTDPPVKFRRARGMLALPQPKLGGSLEDLRPFVNTADEHQWALVKGWVVGTMRPRGPYPGLGLHGEHGTAKSTMARALRRVIDPNMSDLRGSPADERDLMIAAANGWIIALDNLSSLSDWLSDALCRLATGGGLATRELYTDADEMIFDGQRPIILNGINEIITHSDLLDRSQILILPGIPDEKRQTEEKFWREFTEAHPRILGALCHAVSVALRRLPEVRLSAIPRMADFVSWVTAAAPALGWAEGYFVSVYAVSQATAQEAMLEASLVAPLIRQLADEGPWAGTATELLKTLNTMAMEEVRKAKGWPKTGQDVSGILRRLAPNLRAVGVAVEFQDQPELGRRRRQVLIKKSEGKKRSERSDPPAGEASRNAGNAEFTPRSSAAPAASPADPPPDDPPAWVTEDAPG